MNKYRKEWTILEARLPKFLRLSETETDWIVKIQRKGLFGRTITKTVNTTFPINYPPKIGDVVRG